MGVKREQVVAFIEEFAQKNEGRVPTYAELNAALGASSNVASVALKEFRAKRLVTEEQELPDEIRLFASQSVEKVLGQVWKKCVEAQEEHTQERIAVMQKNVNDAQAKEDELAAQNEQLSKERDELKNALISIQTKHDLLQRERDRLEKEKKEALSSLDKERKAAEEAIAVARQSAAESSGARNVLEKQVVELKAQLAEARNQLAELQKQITILPTTFVEN